MESEHGRHEEPEDTGALDDDNPTPPDDAGQKGAGSQTGASEANARPSPTTRPARTSDLRS